MKRVDEGFENRKFAVGKVNLPQSSLNDPRMQNMIKVICNTGVFKLPTDMSKKKSKLCRTLAQATVGTGGKIQPQMIYDWIAKEQGRMDKVAAKAPILYATMKNNVVAGEVFHFFELMNVPTNAERFTTAMFYRLVRAIRADQDEFFPLASFIDRRRLQNPNFVFTGAGDGKKTKYDNVPTACATPSGDFAFNIPFMQKLIDWAFLIGEKPKGLKYVSNGGDIPDEYAPLEFLIMHEFMHYSNGDFYYHKILRGMNGKAKADGMIINWVGDFRSNYLLCKSGYQALPIGLYNDEINYDRQKTYVEMYRLVEEQMKLARKKGGPKPPQPKQPPQGPYVPKIGDIVENHDTYEVGEITKINPDGTVEVTPVDPAKLKAQAQAQQQPPVVPATPAPIPAGVRKKSSGVKP